MRYLFILQFIFTCCLSNGNAQTQTEHVGYVNTSNNYLDGQFKVREKKSKQKLLGDPYLFENQQYAYVVPKRGDKSSLVQVNYNMVTEALEMYIDGEQYGLEIKKIDSLIVFVLDEYGVKVEKQIDYIVRRDDEKKDGLYRVIYEDNISLLEYTYAYIKAPHYNPVLETGNKYHEIKRKDAYYGISKRTPFKIHKKRKNCIRDTKIDKKIRNQLIEKKYNLKNEKGLTKLFKDASQAS